MNLLKKNAHSIYYFGLILMAIALPLSKFLNGLSMFVIIGAWVVGGNYKNKIQLFLSDKIALLWCSVFVLHLIGLLYTSDFKYAINDLRIKLPLLIFPLVMSSSKALSKSEIFLLIKIFIAAVLASTLVSMAVVFGFIHRPITQSRDISFLISHIRLALLICLAIFSILYFIRNENSKPWLKIVYYLAFAWLIIFLFILESMTGIVVLLVLTFSLLLYQLLQHQNTKFKFIYLFVFLVFSAALVVFLRHNYNKVTQAASVQVGKLDSLSSLGNPYLHLRDSKEMENGHLVGLYICTRELDSVWNIRSNMDIRLLDKKGQILRITLFRFLTSKGLRKDAEGVASLSVKEIKAVENGTTNVNYQSVLSVNSRMQQIFWEINTYLQTGNPSGHSFTVRIEYLKTGLKIFKDHWLTGVGTGDVNRAFLAKYDEINSPLSQQWRLRAHNQYLTFGITFGVIGLSWFLFSLFYPLWINRRNLNYFYLIFFIIALISMLDDDTLESQAGLTFFAFFNCLFWFNTKNNSEV